MGLFSNKPGISQPKPVKYFSGFPDVEIMQKLASDINKSKRQPFIDVAISGIAEILWQVTNWSRIFEDGCHRPTHGRTTTLPASHATVGLRHGSFRTTRTRNGKHLRPRVPFYGFMGNVR